MAHQFIGRSLKLGIFLGFFIGTLLSACGTAEKGIKGEASASAVRPRTAQEALLQSLRGTVEIEAQGKWSSISGEAPVYITAGEHVRTGNLSSVQISFFDGSLATLGANAEISIDELDAQAKDKPRKIILTQVSGNSRHSVAKSGDTDSHYEVRTASGMASAKGTDFSVWVLPDQTSFFNVDEGIVVVVAVQISVTVNPGQMTWVNLNNPPAPPVAHISGEGLVTQTGETWKIAQQTFITQADTLLIGTIKAGDLVHYDGHLRVDGSRVLDVVYLLQPSPANHFRFLGTAEKIDSAAWTVDQQVITITSETIIGSNISVGDKVWVEGTILEDGRFQASRINKASEEMGEAFEFSGLVQEQSDTSWMISNLRVTVNPQTSIGEGVEKGGMVRVEGIIQKDGTWLALSIRLAEGQDQPFVFTGAIQSITPWKVAGISFETRPWTQIDTGLKAGDLVRVEGTIQADGVWVAAEISRANDLLAPHLILVGLVMSKAPWVIGGIPFSITSETTITGTVSVGMLVWVEAIHLSDGTWQALKIRSLQTLSWNTGCVKVKAIVVSFTATQIEFQGWPSINLPETVKIDGQLASNQAVLVEICFTPESTLQVISITVITETPEITPPVEAEGKVLICHKPNHKKGGKTMLLPRSALGGHLGHGDTLGACP